MVEDEWAIVMVEFIAYLLNNSDVREGHVIAERFRIIRFVESGGMGSIYKAFDLKSRESVALKLIRERESHQHTSRFRREATALSQIEHPAIVRHIAHGDTDDGGPYLAMEWLNGEDLQQRVRKSSLSEAETIMVAWQICSALAVIHKAGIIHRDIKPSNVFLVANDLQRVKLIDFGLARIGSVQTSLTQSGAMLGTPSFISPEQASSAGSLGSSTDLYSLGATLFTCLTQEPPYIGNQIMAVLAKLLLEPVPRVRDRRTDVSPALDALITKMLAKTASERPASVDEVATVLMEIRTEDRSARTLPPSPNEEHLSGKEQAFFSVLLVGDIERQTCDRDIFGYLRKIVLSYGGCIEQLANGALLAVFAGGSDPADVATGAAGFALALRAYIPNVSVALATGRGQLDEPTPVGEVIDRVSGLLLLNAATIVEIAQQKAGRGDILVDDVTATFLESRFEVRRTSGQQPVLMGIRSQPTTLNRRVVGRTSVCLGRERELTQLMMLFDECIETYRMRNVLIVGPAGIGKSCLIDTFLVRINERAKPPLVLRAYGDPMGTGSTLNLIEQLLVNGIGGDPSTTEEQRRVLIERQVYGRFPAEDAVRMAVFLGELVGAHFSDDDCIQLREARRDPRLMHDQMLLAWQDWLDAMLIDRAVICLLEDIHWSDGASMRFVEAALRSLCDLPLFVVGLAQPDVDDGFPNLWARCGVERISLKPLSPQAAADIARYLGPDDGNDEEIDQLVRRSGGNPFFLEELVRYAGENRNDAPPDTVVTLLGMRLRELPTKERRTLRAASALGQVFWLGALQALLGDEKAILLEHLEELGRRALIVKRRRSRFHGEVEYAFRHDLVREAAYATLISEDRRLAHLHVGTWLEAHGGTDSATLATHYRLGGEPAKAEPWFYRAAQQAMEADDIASVTKHAKSAIQCGAGGVRLGELRRLQAEAYNWVGDHSAARDCGREAVAFLPESSEPWADAIHHLTWAAGELSAFDEVTALSGLLTECLPESPGTSYCVALIWNSAGLVRAGRITESQALWHLVDRVVRASTRAISPFVTATQLVVEGVIASSEGRYEESVDASMRAAEEYRKLGNRRLAGLSQLRVCESLSMLGQYEAAEVTGREVLELVTRIGAEHLAESTICSIALVLGCLGRTDESLAMLDAMMATCTESHRLHTARLVFAQVHNLCGDWMLAVQETEAILDTSTSFLELRVPSLAVRATALLALGHNDEALRCAEQSVELVDESTYPTFAPYLAYMNALHACGRKADACAAAAKARELLLGRAARIASQAWRDSFLYDVVENRTILELATAWSQDD